MRNVSCCRDAKCRRRPRMSSILFAEAKGDREIILFDVAISEERPAMFHLKLDREQGLVSSDLGLKGQAQGELGQMN